MRHLALTVVLWFPLSVLPARGDDLAQDRREVRQDRRELRDDRRALEDDRRDQMRMERLAADLDGAIARRDLRRVAAIDDSVQRELGAERRETAYEAGRERAELRRDAREGDRREFRDDRRDLRAEGATASRRAQIGRELASLRGRYGPGELQRRRVLVGELVRLSHVELRGDVRELREDRRELLEDRRELREDRRDAGTPRGPRDGGPRY